MSSTPSRVAVFISQLRTLDDLEGLFPPETHASVLRTRDNPGYIVSPPFHIGDSHTGYLILMLRSGQEVMADPGAARAKVMEMTECASDVLDADIIGLGSLTTSVTKQGRQVVDEISRRGWRIRATHGDTGAVAAILECLARLGVDRTKRIAIVGAYGVIGTALSRILADRGQPLVLIGRNTRTLAELCLRITSEGGTTPGCNSSLAVLQSVDVVITVTSATDALLQPSMLKPGAIVIDASVPANVTPDPGYAERGITVVSNASQVRVPQTGITSAMLGTLDDSDGCPVAYACLAETLALGVAGETMHRVGEIDLGFVETCARHFRALDFRHAAPRMFGREIDLASLRTR